MKRLIWFVQAVLVIVLAGCSSRIFSTVVPASTAQTEQQTALPTNIYTPAATSTRQSNFDFSKLGSVEYDVPYCTMEGFTLRMDIYYPESNDGRWPALVYVHGGSWLSGDKADGEETIDQPSLTREGFLIAAVNYRLAPDYKFPAMIEDVKCAVRYLRAHADVLNIDSQRIGAWGSSAGGHLVALLGLTNNSAGWDVGEYLDQSSRVQAVVDLYGPTDLNQYWFSGAEARQIGREVFGGKDSSDSIFVAASPVTYITPSAPPFLIVHGDSDTVVPPLQSQLLYAYLLQVSVPVKLVMVQNAGHGLKPVDGNSTIPTRTEITQMIVDFFDQYLK